MHRKEITGGSYLAREGLLTRGEQNETRAHLAQGSLAKGGDQRSGRVGGPGMTGAEPQRPRAPLPPRLPHLRLALPPPLPSPGQAVPSRPAAFISVTPAAAGPRGRGRAAGPGRGRRDGDAAVAPPRHPGKVRPDAGRQQARKAAVEVGTGETAAPPRPPTPRPPPVPHTGCTASSTRE